MAKSLMSKLSLEDELSSTVEPVDDVALAETQQECDNCVNDISSATDDMEEAQELQSVLEDKDADLAAAQQEGATEMDQAVAIAAANEALSLVKARLGIQNNGYIVSYESYKDGGSSLDNAISLSREGIKEVFQTILKALQAAWNWIADKVMSFFKMIGRLLGFNKSKVAEAEKSYKEASDDLKDNPDVKKAMDTIITSETNMQEDTSENSDDNISKFEEAIEKNKTPDNEEVKEAAKAVITSRMDRPISQKALDIINDTNEMLVKSPTPRKHTSKFKHFSSIVLESISNKNNIMVISYMPIIETLNTVLIELASTSEDLTNSDIDKKYPADSESVRTQIDRSNEKMLLTNKAIFKAGSKAYDEIMSLKEKYDIVNALEKKSGFLNDERIGKRNDYNILSFNLKPEKFTVQDGKVFMATGHKYCQIEINESSGITYSSWTTAPYSSPLTNIIMFNIESNFTPAEIIKTLKEITSKGDSLAKDIDRAITEMKKYMQSAMYTVKKLAETHKHDNENRSTVAYSQAQLSKAMNSIATHSISGAVKGMQATIKYTAYASKVIEKYSKMFTKTA